MSVGNWQNTENTIVEIQVGGSGYPWEVVDIIEENSAEFAGPTGGGKGEISDRFGRNYKKGGRLERVGVVRGAEPARWTSTLTLRERLAYAFNRFREFEFNVRARHYLGDPIQRTNFKKIIMLQECFATDGGPYSASLSKGSSGVMDDMMRAYSISASELVEIFQLNHDNISEASPAEAVNRIISTGWPRSPEQDPLIPGINDGNLDYLAVTDKNVSTTHPALILFKDDGAGGLDKVVNAISGMATYDLTGVTKAGPLVLVCGTGGIAYCRYDDLYAGSPTFTLAAGISVPTVITDILAVNATLCYAVGPTGKIYRSTDGGLSWALWNDGLITTENLLRIKMANENLVWIAGAAGKLVKIENNTPSLVATGLSDDLKTVAIPDGRDNEIYIGTDAGEIWASRNSGSSWTERALETVASSSIDEIEFSGPGGCIMWFLQQNGSSKSRVGIDYSGGFGAADVGYIGTFASPVNGVMNCIAPSDANHAVTVGEVVSSKGWIGRISPKI